MLLKKSLPVCVCHSQSLQQFFFLSEMIFPSIIFHGLFFLRQANLRSAVGFFTVYQTLFWHTYVSGRFILSFSTFLRAFFAGVDNSLVLDLRYNSNRFHMPHLGIIPFKSWTLNNYASRIHKKQLSSQLSNQVWFPKMGQLCVKGRALPCLADMNVCSVKSL